jgi:hypothetical protein
MRRTRSRIPDFVMPALGAGIHEFGRDEKKVVDARAKPGHDDVN